MKVIIDGKEYVRLPVVPKGKGLAAALEVRIEYSDAGNNITIRDYLRKLLETLWEKSEGFSGKRPFGNSGWQYDLQAPLIKEGFLDGKLDCDGYVSECDNAVAYDYVLQLIREAFK